jgi:cellulose synthase/poly-beta-1,6-N-acetylglucosamine synthase-like glycosyltransferase
LAIVDIIQAIGAGSLVILVAFYASYAVMCYLYGRKPTTALPLPAEKDLQTLTIIIPTHNEVNVVKERLENLRVLRYPRDRLQIVFVDSGSEDGTADKIDSLSAGLSVKLVRKQMREGYNQALIDGFSVASGELIAFSGAETQFEPDALIQMAKYFKRKEVGAVTGRQQIGNLNGISAAIEAGYRSLYNFVRLAESVMDSPFDIKGEICIGRREVVQELVTRPELAKRGCIDTCLSFQSRQMGLRTVYEPAAVYHEDAPYRLTESFAQETRRGATLIQNMLLFKNLMLNRRFGQFGMIIMPAHFIMLIIMPFLFLLTVITLTLASILDPYSWSCIVLLLGIAATAVSRSMQGFVKTQLSLIAANIGLGSGLDTQRFKRLPSTRMSIRS